MPVDTAQPQSKFTLNLLSFINVLRDNGVQISTGEVADAFSALSNVDLVCRDSFKAALQATLVKNRPDRDKFNAIFDAYFVPYAKHADKKSELEMVRDRYAKKVKDADSDMQFMGQSLELTDHELEQYTLLPETKQKSIQQFIFNTETGKNIKPQFKPLLETVVKSHLRYCRHNERNEANGRHSNPAAGAGSHSSTDSLAIREMDIQHINESDFFLAESLLRNFSHRLAVKMLRSKKHGLVKNKFDFRRSLRSNMRFGGSIYNLQYKAKHSHRHQVLLLCDVSASMKLYSSFVIQFMSGLKEAIKELSCFIFSDRLENIDNMLTGRKTLKEITTEIIRYGKTWGGGTNIAFSLELLLREYKAILSSRSTVIIVSDTMTINIAETQKMIAKLRDEVRDIIWLNPLPLEVWHHYRSVSLISELVEMWPCNTINQLETALASYMKLK